MAEGNSSVISPAEWTASVTSSVMETTSAVSGSLCSSTPNMVTNPLTLTEVWEIYIRAVKSQDQSADNVERQSMLLDLLLYMCTSEIRSGAVPSFSDMKSVCNQLCKELMTDILHITNKSDDDDSSQLQGYLLEGRGFQLLQVIHRKGVQNVSGCRDLANLLVSLLPWCLKFPLQSPGIQEPDLELLEQHSSHTPISQSFQQVYRANSGRATQLKSQAMPSARRSTSTPKELSRFLFYGKSTDKRRFSKRKSMEITSKDLQKVSNNDSSDAQTEKSTKSKVKRKSRYYHIHSKAERQAAQQKVDSDSDDDDLYDLLQTVKRGEMRISGFELCLLVLELLLELTAADLDETSPGKFISIKILPQLLHSLTNLSSELARHPSSSKEVEGCLADSSENWDRKARQILIHLMVRVVFSCCAIIATQQNGTNILTSHKVFETVLSIGQRHTKSFAPDSTNTNFSKYSCHLDLMSDCVIGLIHCLCIVFENLPFNLSFIKSAVGLLETFDSHRGFQMLSQCILYHDWLKTETNSEDNPNLPEDEPLKAFGAFLNTMKIVRVNYLHSMKCVKRKHQKCSYAQYFDHHHDILGIPAKKQQDFHSFKLSDKQQFHKHAATAGSDLSSHTVCLVASSTQFLLELLVKVGSKPMRLDLLKTVYSSGFCCCMDLQDITSAFVVCAAKFTPAVGTFALDTYNKIILEHFSGSLTHNRQDLQKVACSTCDALDLSQKQQQTLHKKYGVSEPGGDFLDSKGLDSGIDSSDAMKEKLPLLCKISRWRPVSLLRTLLYSSDETLAVAVAKHLMVLAIKGNLYLKTELFFSVYSNAMESVSPDTEKGSSSTSQTLAKSVQVHCLSALPYLLQANCVTKAFLSKNGVRKLCELLEDNTLRVPVLRIFEALVVQDEQKLFTSVAGQQEECPCPYKGGAVIETFVEELSKRSFSNFNEPCYYDQSSKPSSRIRHNSAVLSLFSLPALVDLWQTCAKLCLQNHAFITLFQDSQNMYLCKTESLLLETLDILTSPNLIGWMQSHGSVEAEDSGMEGDQVTLSDGEDSDADAFNMRISLLESLMVVVGACYNFMEKQNCIRYSAWSQMKERFRQPLKLKAVRLKSLLDTILNAATPQLTSVLEYSYYKNIALVYMRDDDVYDEDEVRQLLQSCSEEEIEVTTEIGYDADSEGTHADDTERDKRLRQPVLIPSGASHKVYFPPTFRLLFELLVWIQDQDTDNFVVHPVLHKLVQTVRADPSVVQAMCKQDVLSLILSENGFWSSLLKQDSESSVQDNLLVLIQYMGQHKLKSCDLQKILQLFQHSDIPMEHLLSKFLPIIENSQPVAHHCVVFPTQASSDAAAHSAREVLTPTQDCLTGSVSPLLKTVTSLFMSPVSKPEITNHGMAGDYQQQEVWPLSPVQLTLKDAIAWPPFQNGFTLALWLRLDADDKQNYAFTMPMYNLDEVDETSQPKARDDGFSSKHLHVVSIGTTEKLLEVWADTATNSLLFRLTSEVSDMGLVVREMPLTGVMSPARWQHLVVSYVESLDGSTLTGKTTVILDGWQSHSFVLDHPFSAIRARHRSSTVLHPVLCLGHAAPEPCLSQAGTWSLGNLLLFKGAAISKENIFHLYTLGPNCESIVKCDCSDDRARYAPHLHKNTILHSKISHDALVGLSKVDLTELRYSLLLSYNPRHSTKMSLYPSVSRSSQSQVSGNLGYIPDGLLTQQPRVVSPLILGQIQTTVNESLERALEETGGMAAMLFLVAKVYERCPESMPAGEAEKIQSEALKVLLSVVHHSSLLQEEYTSLGGHALLCKVLTSCRRVVGPLILKVLMDAATTDSIYKNIQGSGELMLRHKSDAVIRDVTVISELILQWHVWEGSGQRIVELLFAGLALLVREDHPHQQYNLKQFQMIGIVQKVFKVYQERIQEGFPALPISVSQSVVAIVQSMLGSPPDPHLVVELCDFLLMVHPAANTYINHSRSSFYFTLSGGLPPSPLSEWKQGLTIHSTPIKEDVSQTEESSKKAVWDLTKDLERKLEDKTYPIVEILTKPTKDNDPSHDNADIASRKAHFAVEPPKEELATSTTVDNVDGVHSSTLLADQYIPENFESLYKKTGSSDGHESPQGMTDSQVDSCAEVERSGSDLSVSDVTEEAGEMGEMSANNADLSLNFDEDNAEQQKLEQGLTALCVGLLRLLSSTIVMMPDVQVEKTFTRSVISPQMFIVLMQNSSSQIREAVIKVIASYLSRSNPSHTDAFLRLDGFHLMSAQLYQYPTHQEQMEAAVSIVMQRPFYVDEGLRDDEVIEELTPVQQSAIPMMLALLGNSVADLALCHNSLQFATRLFEVSDPVAMVMVEQGVVEVVCNMLQKLFDSGSKNTDVEGMDENEILLGDLLDFLKVIAVREFSVSGPQHYQHFEDILVLLQEMERKERENEGLEARSVQTLRRFQYHILVAIMEVVEKATEECNQSSFSLFNRMTSRTPQYADSQPSSSSPSLLQVSSTPVLPHHHRGNNRGRGGTGVGSHLSLSSQHFSLTGALGRLTNTYSHSHHSTYHPPHRKSPGGYFVQSDHPFPESSRVVGGAGTSGTASNSGGDSDSSLESSWVTSIQSINLPVGKPGYLRGKPVDISTGKLARSNTLLQTVLSIGKKKKMATVPISQKELIERLKKVVTMSVDIASFSERAPRKQRKEVFLFEMVASPDNIDGDFLKRLFIFNYRAFETTLPQEKSSYKRTKNSIVWGAKDTLRVQLSRLLCYMLSDRVERELRVYALSFIMGEQRGVDILKLLIGTADVANDLAYHVRQLLVEGRQLLARQQSDDGARLLNYLSSAGHMVISATRQPSEEQLEMLEERRRLIWSKHDSEKVIWLKRKDVALNRIFHRLDGVASRLCDTAMEVTQSVTQLQTAERNKFITHIKHNKMQSIHIKKQWQEIVQNLTHERAIWFDEKSYPRSWQLNPTEGPCRVRKRLQRGHLGILPKFLLKEYQCKLATETVDPPLIYLFEDDHQMSDSAALIYQLHKNKKIRYTCSCRAVSPNSESKGELLIGEDSVFFVADEAITDANYTQVLLGNKDQLSMTWPFEEVVEIHKRWYELMDTGLEIFLTNGKTCLLALRTAKERDDLFQHLNQLELPNRVYTCNLMDVIFNWENGHITNFEYLTHLNKLAGRSFNDLMQYPIMPFILRDYLSERLDLEDRRAYRDLTKPVSVQEERNEQKFLMNYAILKQEYDKCGKKGITGLRVAPYHYGSHYSNSGCVLHFLVRLPPFTKMFLNFQDQSFDIPDRTFHNLATSWRLSSAESNTDVKELIPEFFFCHEFLRNSEGFDFGCRQNGEPVLNVVLPPWCEDNPRLFILIHRQALESDHVTEYIGAWIDLIFGYKQQGEQAVKAINVFHPATYFGLDVSSVKSPVDRKAIQTMVRTYGQTPKQLFKIPHSFKRAKEPSRQEYQRQPSKSPQLKSVTGLKWGSYLGSPDRPDPEVSWQQQYSSQVVSLVALPRGYVFGIGAKSCLLVQHSQEKQKALMTDTPSDVVWAAIVTWGQTDRFLRIINGLNKPPVNLLQYNQSDEVMCCVSLPDCRYIIIGGSSGVITVYNSKHNPAKESQLQVFNQRRCLYGHTGSVQALVVCKPYSIMVSASQDASCIIWDLNRLSYVRSITGLKSGVQVLAVSDTLGDIASVCHHGLGSYLYLHTVNAEFVAMTMCEDTINCLAYSTAPEGASINAVAGGLSSGVIRLWSSWDLSPIRDLCHPNLSATPIISLTFSKDSQRLYASSADGRVSLWDYSKQAENRSAKFKPYLYPS